MPGGSGGHNGRSTRKRFCPRCANRVSRSANRCWCCGKFLPSRRGVAAIALLFIVLVASAARLTGLL
jgi:predicted amidophosphoribosyltransferase